MKHITQTHKDFVKELIEDDYGVEKFEIEEDSCIQDDFGIDSLDKLELIMKIEKQFNFTISDVDMEDINTMADLYLHMDEALEEKIKKYGL